MRAADRAWAALLAGVITYEALAPKDELLSEGWDRYLNSRPITARIIPPIVALHLMNVLPHRVDPIHNVFVLSRLVKGLFNVRCG